MSNDIGENYFEDEGDLLEVIQEQPDEDDNQISNENAANADDEEESKRIVKPKKHVYKPRLKLDVPRLLGPRGIGVLESTFKDIKFKGKGHELEDLNLVLNKLEHWAHRLFPQMSFDDCIDKIEDLSSKKSLMTRVNAIRLGMVEEVNPEPEIVSEPVEIETVDPFDELLPKNSKPSQPPPLTDEQKARMMRNRLIAEELRMKKIQARQDKLRAEQANKEHENSVETSVESI